MVIRRRKVKPRRRLVKRLGQTGKRKSIVADRRRKALGSGKRKSSTGKTYWETRRNRSDRKGSLL